jgi:signal transduction histidine kinase
MTGYLKKLRYFGTSSVNPEWRNRGITATNTTSIVCFFLMGIMAVVHAVSHQEFVPVFAAALLMLAFISVPFIQRSGKTDFGRTLLTILLMFGTLGLTIARKFNLEEHITVATFYIPRLALLVFLILPFTTFHFKEKKWLACNILIGLMAIALFDPIHNVMGVGFYQAGFIDPDYYYGNFFLLIISFILIGFVGFFKKELDDYAQRNEMLIEQLHAQNAIITEQKEELEIQGEALKDSLNEKDRNLSVVNQQLISFNHELLQYSYTISHNLRGPVARISGLLDILDKHSLEAEKPHVIQMLLKSTQSLDDVIRDLNRIVDARSNSFDIREHVIFSSELDKIQKLLAIQIEKHQVQITSDFKVENIFCARERVNHILFCLMSNAIQFRKQAKAAIIHVSTYKENGWIVLSVEDNGKGIDLNLYGKDLFKPFRYFHPDSSGKGIGLYLVKLQVERLHGKIEVKSSPGHGAKFLVSLKDWRE